MLPHSLAAGLGEADLLMIEQGLGRPASACAPLLTRMVERELLVVDAAVEGGEGAPACYRLGPAGLAVLGEDAVAALRQEAARHTAGSRG